MNISTSECSSGCESGWTMYLDQLSNSTDPYSRNFHTTDYHQGISKGVDYPNNDDDDEDEDESMVSDASSGPPHFHEYDYENRAFDHARYSYGCASNSVYSEDKKKSKNKSKIKEPIRAKNHHSLCLDDTASSPVYHFSQDNVPPNSGTYNSVEHIEGESKTKKNNFGFFKSSTKGKSSGSLLGRQRQ